MSRHSKKHRSEQQNGNYNGANSNNFDMSQLGNLFNNMNPNQFSGLLNNVDMNQVSSMLNGLAGNGGAGENNAIPPGSDRRVELLNAIKPLVDADKSRMIDSILQLYTITKIMKR